MRVKNLKNTSDNKTSQAWIDYWKKHTGKSIGICTRLGCIKDAEVGAHVIKVNSSDKDWYIVPLCKECNKKSEAFTLKSGASLVPANTQKV